MKAAVERVKALLRRAGGERTALGILLAGVVAFYCWTVMSTMNYEWKFEGNSQGDYFNLLADGFLDGHLYLKTEVPESLRKLDNPYDPQQRRAVAVLHDASYFRGHYYLYFGATPVVVLYLPFTLLTGQDLPQYYGNILFSSIGFLAASGLFLAARRRYFSGSGTGAALAGVLVLGLGSMVLSVLRRPSFWELPIASAYCFGMLTLVSVFCALHSRRRMVWMGAAGLALGLAVGSRPTYIVTSGLLAAPLLWFWWEGRGQRDGRWWPGRSWWKCAWAGGLGFGAVVAGLLWYNDARFGNPREFGLNYQLTSLYEAKETHFSPRFIPFNAYVYYFSPAQWSRYFPFIGVIHEPKHPEGYYGVEFVYGVMICLPLAWLALASPLALRNRTRAERGPLAALLATIALCYLPLGAVMLFFVTAAARYMVDFTPALMLLACCGVLAVDRWKTPCLGHRLGQVVWGGAALVTIFFGVMTSFQLHELLRINDPSAHRVLAHFFDQPSRWYEQFTGAPLGPVELTVRLPKDCVGQDQLLVSTGREFYSDHAFIRYLEGDRVQLGFIHNGYDLRLSEPIKVDFERPHLIRVEMGSLYPPEGHPFFDGKTDAEVFSLSRWLQVTFDGRSVMRASQAFFDGVPGNLRLGGGGVAPDYGRAFTGRILQAGRGKYEALSELDGMLCPIKISVLFPQAFPARNQPLVVTGTTGRGDALYVRSERPGFIRFGYDHWGYSSVESGEVACDFAALHEIDVRMGGLLPPAPTPDAAAMRESLVVTVDGHVVWSRRLPYYDNPDKKITVGSNRIGASSCDAVISAAIRRVESAVLFDSPPEPNRGILRMQIVLPSDRPGRSEPLVAAGDSRGSNLFFVSYLEGGRVQFGFSDGAHVWQSPAIAVDYGSVQRLEIQLPAMAPGAGPASPAAGELELRLNGDPAWTQRAEFLPMSRDGLAIGENPFGNQLCDAVFTGGIVQLK